MIVDAIRALLLASQPIADAVGGRVFPYYSSDNPAFPQITMNLVTTDHKEHLTGSNGEARSIVQINCWAETYRQAAEMGTHVRLAMQGFSGQAADNTINFIHMQDERDAPEAPSQGRQRAVFGRQIDIAVWHAEAVAA